MRALDRRAARSAAPARDGASTRCPMLEVRRSRTPSSPRCSRRPPAASGNAARGVQLGVRRSRARSSTSSASGFDRERVTAARAGGADRARREAARSARRSARRCSTRCTRPAAAPTTSCAADGLAQIGDEGAMLSSVRAVIAANQDAVAQIRAGKTGTFGLPRRSGDEGDRRQGEPEARERAIAPGARP